MSGELSTCVCVHVGCMWGVNYNVNVKVTYLSQWWASPKCLNHNPIHELVNWLTVSGRLFIGGPDLIHVQCIQVDVVKMHDFMDLFMRMVH